MPGELARLEGLDFLQLVGDGPNAGSAGKRGGRGGAKKDPAVEDRIGHRRISIAVTPVQGR